MKVNKKVLFIAILFGLVTILFLNNYIKSLEKVEDVGATIIYIDVVVAQKTIPAHTRITEDMLKITPIPEEGVHPDAMLSLDKVVGGISRGEIINGEQILSGRIVTDEIHGSLSYRIPENMRAITIPINEVSGVAGYIALGDKIDILVTYEDEKIVDNITTYTQLQNIEVLNIGIKKKEIEGEEDLTLPNTLTVLVNPAQAEVLAFANINGTFHLALRSPIDTTKVELNYYNKNNLESFRVR